MIRAFVAHGQPLALNPRAFGMVLIKPSDPPAAKMLEGGIALVEVQGPLMHHPDPCADSYDAIKARVIGALADGATKVVLSIDSPGGLVSGCFDTAEEIRAACDARAAELVAYVDGQSTSAAYALACVASRVFVPPTGLVGSIGVIDALVDETVRDSAMGVGYALVASGTRKSDGNPHAATTDAAVAAAQQRVDSLAGHFFAHVSKHRGIAPERVAALQASIVVGPEAISAGLADQVATLDQVLALVRTGAGASTAATTAQQESSMDENEKAVRASLQAVIDGDGDEKSKTRAKAALAAYDDEAEGDDAPEDDPKDPDAGEAEGDDAPADDPKEPDGDEGKAAASARAAGESRLDRIERRQLMAMRPDLSEEQRKSLALVPLAGLEAALAAIPRTAPKKPAAAATATGTRGEGQGGAGAGRMTLEQANAALGIKSEATGIVRDGLEVRYHAMTPAEARAYLKNTNGGAR